MALTLGRVADGDEMSSAWAALLRAAIEDVTLAATAAIADDGSLLIARHGENPAQQSIAAGSTATVDWAVLAGAQAAVLISRRSSPIDPAAVEYWSGSAWVASAQWRTSAQTVAAVGGWDAAGVYALSVEARTADGAVSNALTWAVVVVDADDDDDDDDTTTTPTEKTVMAVTPAAAQIAHGTTTATIRVRRVSGPTPTQVRIKRTNPDGTSEYWGGSWQSSEAWAAWAADAQGGADYALPDFAAGQSSLTVSARVSASAAADTYSAPITVTVTRAAPPSSLPKPSPPTLHLGAPDPGRNNRRAITATWSPVAGATGYTIKVYHDLPPLTLVDTHSGATSGMVVASDQAPSPTVATLTAHAGDVASPESGVSNAIAAKG